MRLIIHTFSCATAVLLGLTSVAAHAGQLDCTGCHAGSGDIRPIDAPYRNISTGGFRGNHRTHMSITATAATCAVCHNNSNFQTDHRNYQIQVNSKISNYSGIYGKATYRTTRSAGSNGSSVFFNQTSVPTLASCTNVSCHFETITPIWGIDAATAGFNCSSCHGNPPAGTAGNNYSGGVAGSHEKHSSLYTFACSKCHSDHTLDASPFGHATSIGKRDLVVTPRSPDLIPLSIGTYTNIDRNYLPGQTASHTFGSCANTYCHSNATRSNPPYTAANGSTPSWGNPASASCGTCHKATGGDPISTGSHTAHINPNNYGPKLDATGIASCQNCHIYSENAATHVNGQINLKVCTPCHPGSAPAWTAKIVCQDCHGKFGTSIMNNMSAPNKWGFATQQVGRLGVGGHSAVLSGCGIASPLFSCHRDHSLASPQPGHISGVRGDYRGLYNDMDPPSAETATLGNDACQLCHSTAVQRSHVTSSNNLNPNMVCNKCHDPHGSGNLQMVRAVVWAPAQPPTAISFSNRSTFVKYIAPYDGICQTCHDETAHFKRGIPEPAGAGQHGNLSNRICTSCHQHGISPADTVAYAFQAPRCDSCHGYPPVSSMTGYGTQSKFSTAGISLNHQNSGGAHTAFGHLAPTIKATDANPWQACQPCHSGGAATHRVAAQVKGFAAYSAQVPFSITYKAKSGTATYNPSTCSNISCHGGGTTPAWTADPGFAIGDDLTAYSCLQCHAVNLTDRTAGTPENNSPYSGWDTNYFSETYSNLHDWHVRADWWVAAPCTDCHDQTNLKLGKGSAHFASLSSATMSNASNTLRNDQFDYAPNAPAGSKGTCSNVSCHFMDFEPRTW